MPSAFERIAGILASHCESALDVTRVVPETPLFDGGMDLTSISLLESIVEIETTFGVRILGEDLTSDALSSVGQLAVHVCGLIPGTSAARSSAVPDPPPPEGALPPDRDGM